MLPASYSIPQQSNSGGGTLTSQYHQHMQNIGTQPQQRSQYLAQQQHQYPSQPPIQVHQANKDISGSNSSISLQPQNFSHQLGVEQGKPESQSQQHQQFTVQAQYTKNFQPGF